MSVRVSVCAYALACLCVSPLVNACARVCACVRTRVCARVYVGGCARVHVCACVRACATGGKAVWHCPGAAQHVDEPAFTGSPTVNVLATTGVGLKPGVKLLPLGHYGNVGKGRNVRTVPRKERKRG